ncbi:1-acyl-sn-glycerol-3-phosphate acyltransferase [Ekhidna lutea]|uniref:1-acyl-sn-glycerol-3-phosphate acyltransferase n=2 Tax=Ekhidna lutea TaxID=447679 RepID=A0A239IVS9_EKHLU|nr:1-acyl-sn-glycerol-3-phosphate acyltransferase [Ekhidna lutea]
MILRRLYSFWAIFSIVFFFAILIIPLILMVPFRGLHKVALKINCIWAWCFLKMAFIPVKIDWRFTLDKTQQYILCANHFSYLDIPILGLFPLAFKFVGKSSLARIPLFGYMYRTLHITVNRSSYRSRAQSLVKARDQIKNGFNLGFFPEGGIRMEHYPNMKEFKDGAFRLAIENNLPIIPVTMPDNYRILRDDDIINIRWRKCRIIYHEPIWPDGSDDEALKKLKDEVFRVIQTELIKSKPE